MKRRVKVIALWIAETGCINTGLAGTIGFNAITQLFGSNTLISKLTYGLIGLSGLYLVVEWSIRKFTAKKKKAAWPYNKASKASLKGRAKR